MRERSHRELGQLAKGCMAPRGEAGVAPSTLTLYTGSRGFSSFQISGQGYYVIRLEAK